MILPSIQNFLEILRFYQLNSIKDVKELSKRSYQFDSVEKFYNSLNYNYDYGNEGLTYPKDSDSIGYAINARNDLATYFFYHNPELSQ